MIKEERKHIKMIKIRDDRENVFVILIYRMR